MRTFLSLLLTMQMLEGFASPVKSTIAFRETIAVEDKDSLPYGAVAVEYLAGDGASWIDTGIVPDNSIEIEVTAQGSDSSSPYLIGFGPNADNPYQWVIIIRYANPYGQCVFVRGIYDYKYRVPIRSMTTIRLTKTNIIVNGVPSDYPGADVSPRAGCRVYVFAGGGTTKAFGICNSGIHIRDAKVFKGGECVWDGRAVKFKNENGLWEGAMLDMVSGELFRNAGSGTFTIGPDVR